MVKIIAEISGNHHGNKEKAIELVNAAAQSGADLVKFQMWKQDTMAMKGHIIRGGPWDGRELNDLYRETYTPWEWMTDLFKEARSLGITPFVSVFDRESLDAIQFLKPELYKVASFELVDLPLIKRIAKTRRPLLLSTGMATEIEILEAVGAGKGSEITLMKCTSGYPAPPEEINLHTMTDFYFRFHTRVGLSDHTKGIGVAVAAAAMGASYIEKHLILSRSEGGPDASFSMEPDEFYQMSQECKLASKAVGKIKYGPTLSESTSLPLRRSLYWATTLESGQVIQAQDLKTARPSLGISPKYQENLIGRKVTKSVTQDNPVNYDDVEVI